MSEERAEAWRAFMIARYQGPHARLMDGLSRRDPPAAPEQAEASARPWLPLPALPPAPAAGAPSVPARPGPRSPSLTPPAAERPAGGGFSAFAAPIIPACSCQWAMWGDGERGGLFCGRRSLSGCSWCAEHYGRVFARPTAHDVLAAE